MNVDEITVRWHEGDELTVEELDKRVLASSSTWTTIAFVARERDPTTKQWRAPRVQLRRYKKKAGRWLLDKHFTLSSSTQAHTLWDALTAWTAAGGVLGQGSDDVDDG